MQILGSSSLPTISEEVLSLARHSTPVFSANLQPDLILPVIVLDLACGGATGHDASTTLVNMAQQRLEVARISTTTNTDSGVTDSAQVTDIPGIAGLVKKLEQRHHLSQTENLAEGLAKYYCSGVQKALTTVSLPLVAKDLKTMAVCCHEVDRALRKAEGSFDELSEQIRRHAEMDDEEGVKPVIRIAMRNLIYVMQKYLPKLGLVRFLLR